ncbi:MAG: ubiquinone/menaquinone biosynthesis methyltransferase [Anaerolineaceae bacterium]
MSASLITDKASYVQDVFDRIAPRYDLMNRLMTGAQDVRWRRLVIRKAQVPPGGRLLDLGAGTGDLAREALRRQPDCRPLAADFTLQMMLTGKKRPSSQLLDWSAADAMQLPFPDCEFDSLVSGFLLRNVTDVSLALAEQLRVLKPGAWMACLDTTRPQPNLLSPFIKYYMRRVIPFLGTFISGQRDAYTYLPVSSENFLRAEELLARMAAAGFQQIGFQRLMFGTVAIHWGRKPAAP